MNGVIIEWMNGCMAACKNASMQSCLPSAGWQGLGVGRLRGRLRRMSRMMMVDGREDMKKELKLVT